MGHVPLGMPRRAGGYSPGLDPRHAPLDPRHAPGSDALVGKMQNIADFVLGTNSKVGQNYLKRVGSGGWVQEGVCWVKVEFVLFFLIIIVAPLSTGIKILLYRYSLSLP